MYIFQFQFTCSTLYFFPLKNGAHHMKLSKGMFCRVVGSVKTTDGITHVMALNISKLSTANEIATHLLETQWIKMKLRQLKKIKLSTTNTNSDSKKITLTPSQNLVYTIVKVSIP